MTGVQTCALPISDLLKKHPGSVAVSAVTGEGIELLLRTLSDRMRALSRVVELLIPYDHGEALAMVHREGEVVSVAHEDAGTRIRARLSDASFGRLRAYAVDGAE